MKAQAKAVNRIIRELAVRYNKDSRVIQAICDHPIIFVKGMMNELSERPIRIKYFGVFSFKSTADKARVLAYKSNIIKNTGFELLAPFIKSGFGVELTDEAELNEYIDSLASSLDKKAIDRLYKFSCDCKFS